MYSNELICNILQFIDNNLNKKITIEEISNNFFYNRFYIMKLFKKEIGVTLIVYINSLRVLNSIKSIRDTNDSFTKIAIYNGFYSLEYFSEIFHMIIGVSPRTFRRYCNNRFSIAENELILISNNLIKLQNLIDTTNKYQKNKKPIGIPVLKRSIFK